MNTSSNTYIVFSKFQHPLNLNLSIQYVWDDHLLII